MTARKLKMVRGSGNIFIDLGFDYRDSSRLERAFSGEEGCLDVMRMRYDAEVDALYLELTRAKIVESDEVGPGIIVDLNAKNDVVGIEILNFKRRLPKADLKRLKRLVK